VSDWGGVDQVVPGDYPASLAQGINAGIDMVMVPTDYGRFTTTMTALVQAGTVSQARMDDAVSRILRVKFEMGLFEMPMPAAGRLGDRLTYDPGAAFQAGTKADVGIVVVAERPYAEGVGDSSTLDLPSEDVALVAKVRPLVKSLVVVAISGRPVILGNLVSADAVVAAWLPGTEGTGVADVLLGDEPFVGTTPYTWPKAAADAPRFGKAACDGA